MANPLVHEYPVLIREFHLDTFGHVNNAQYLALFEEARWQVITERGFGLKEIQAAKIGPVLLEVNLKFRKELKLRDQVIIRTWVGEDRGRFVVLKQSIINPRGEEACIAEFTIALFDTTSRRIIDPTPEWRRALALE